MGRYCKKIGCTVQIFHTDHCNNKPNDKPVCDAPIVWKDYTDGGRPKIHPDTNRPRPLNAPKGNTLHKCMEKGQKIFFEKKKLGSKITDYPKEKEDF